MLTIRPATLAHAEGIARVDIDSHIEAYRHIFGDSYMQGASFESFVERWQRFIQGDTADPRIPEHILVAVEGESVTGYTGFGRSRDDDVPEAGEIFAIYVAPAHWRSGTGRALMSTALTWLREGGFSLVVLWALAENDIGRRFYEKEGWTLDDLTKTPTHGHAEVRYRKLIAPGS